MGFKRMIAVRGITGHIELTREAATGGGAADLGSKVVIKLNNDRIVQGPPATVDRDPGTGGTNGRAERDAGLDKRKRCRPFGMYGPLATPPQIGPEKS